MGNTCANKPNPLITIAMKYESVLEFSVTSFSGTVTPPTEGDSYRSQNDKLRCNLQYTTQLRGYYGPMAREEISKAAAARNWTQSNTMRSNASWTKNHISFVETDRFFSQNLNFEVDGRRQHTDNTKLNRAESSSPPSFRNY